VRFTACPPNEFAATDTCRQSDSTFSEIEEAADATAVATIRLGHITRPPLLNTETDPDAESCLNPDGSPGVNPNLCCENNPQFCDWNSLITYRIVNELYPVVGRRVTKVDQRTEHLFSRYLSLHASSMCYLFLQVSSMCSSWASTLGPAKFRKTWLKPLLVTVGRFSPIWNVEAELGPLNTCVPQNPC
jgi:hypothetical protein